MKAMLQPTIDTMKQEIENAIGHSKITYWSINTKLDINRYPDGLPRKTGKKTIDIRIELDNHE